MSTTTTSVWSAKFCCVCCSHSVCILSLTSSAFPSRYSTICFCPFAATKIIGLPYCTSHLRLQSRSLQNVWLQSSLLACILKPAPAYYRSFFRALSVGLAVAIIGRSSNNYRLLEIYQKFLMYLLSRVTGPASDFF